MRYIQEDLKGEIFFLPNKSSKMHVSTENSSNPISISTIQEGLSLFFEKEQLEEKEVYKCEVCKNSSCAVREFYLSKCPLTLALHLKRFSGSSYLISKSSIKVEFTEHLSLEDYICFNRKIKKNQILIS